MARSLLRLLIATCAAATAACAGPPAPDAALCRDVLHRLCLAPQCPIVLDRFAPAESCEATLLTRTGCDSDEFTFTTPSRETFISCRNILVQTGLEPEKAPACEDVEAMLNQCGEVVAFLEAP